MNFRRSIYFLSILSLLLTGCSYEPEPDKWDKISAEVYCKKPLLTLLRDPGSYQFIEAFIIEKNGEYDQYGKAVISYRSKNGFGGYVSGLAECDRFNRDGENRLIVKLIDANKANKLVSSYQNRPTLFKVGWDTRDTYNGKKVKLETEVAAVCDRPPLGGTKGSGQLEIVNSGEKFKVGIEPCIDIKTPAVRMSDGRVLYLEEFK